MSKITNVNKQFKHLSGLERVKQFDGQSERFGMAGNLDYDIVEYSEGAVIYRYRTKERHINLIGTLHGGVLASLLDTAMGAAVMTLLDVGESHTMTDLNVKFIRAVYDEDDELTITANVEHAGRRMFVTEGTVKDSQGRLVARAMANAIRL